MTISDPLDPLDLGYPGGKGLAGLHQWICSLLPSHVYYCEPFCGKGGIFRNKVPALRSLLIDRDPEVVTWWHRQGDRCELSNDSPGIIDGSDDEDLRSSLAGLVDGIRVDHRRRRRAVMAMTGNGIRWIELAGEWAIPDLLVYADPPYLRSTRVKKSLYRFEMSDRDHRRLLRAMKRLPGPAAISGYESDMYLEALADWHCHRRQVITRGGTLRTECLWINGDAAATAAVSMQYSELAGSFRERERINRKRARWVANFERLGPRERRAILLSLLDAERNVK